MSDALAAVRSFIDLRAFAASAEAPATGDWRTARAPLPLAPGRVTIDLIALDGRAGSAETQDGDEFVIVLDGSLTLDVATLAPGASAVIPAGTRFAWRATPGTRAIAMRCTTGPSTAGGPATAAGIVPIDEAAALEPSGAPLAELLVGPTPACRNHTDYRSADGEFVCGTWDSTPYHRLPMRYRHHELMHLTQGAVTFEDEAGRRATFSTGDVFLVEQGAECSWDNREQVKKVYAIWRPA